MSTGANELLPPQDLEAENAVLGAILLDPAAITRVRDFLNPEDFYRENNGQVYRAALNLFREGPPLDNVTLGSELEKLGVLERVGGRGHLAWLEEQVPTAANVEHHGRIVRNLSVRRAALQASKELGQAAANQSIDLDTVAERARQVAEKVIERGQVAHSLPVRTPAQLVAETPEEPPSVVRWLVLPGVITELSAPIKAGKTRFLMEMIRASLEGRPFLGLRTEPAFWMLVSEEGDITLSQALRDAGLDKMNRPEDFLIVSRRQLADWPWPRLVEACVREAQYRAAGRPAALLVDTLSRCAGLGPEAEKDPGHAAVAMEPLTRAAAAGLAVATGRHDRKSGGEVGESARGSSAFGGEADVLLQLRRVRRGDHDEAPLSNVRELAALSRFQQTPGQDDPLRIRLEPTGYVVLGTLGETAAAKAERRYQAILDVVRQEPGIGVAALRMKVKASTADTGADVKALLEEGRLDQREVPYVDDRGRHRKRLGLFVPAAAPVLNPQNERERHRTGSSTETSRTSSTAGTHPYRGVPRERERPTSSVVVPGPWNQNGISPADTSAQPNRCPVCRTENDWELTASGNRRCMACAHEWMPVLQRHRDAIIAALQAGPLAQGELQARVAIHNQPLATCLDRMLLEGTVTKRRPSRNGRRGAPPVIWSLAKETT